MKILLDSSMHFEDHRDTCGRVEEKRGCRRATKVAAGQPKPQSRARVMPRSPLRNHTGGPFLPAKLAPFLAAIDKNLKTVPNRHALRALAGIQTSSPGQ